MVQQILKSSEEVNTNPSQIKITNLNKVFERDGKRKRSITKYQLKY